VKGGDLYYGPLDWMDRKKQQVPPLRFGSTASPGRQNDDSMGVW
jgi:hypothetical protein